jgi:hypothetical protein
MNNQKPKRGRRPAKDPKIEIRFWVETSKIKKHGGKESAIEQCKKMLSK